MSVSTKSGNHSGTRIHPQKTNLLVLDFLWHTERHALVRPAHLVASSPAEAYTITAILEAAAKEFGTDGGADADGRDLLALVALATARRENEACFSLLCSYSLRNASRRAFGVIRRTFVSRLDSSTSKSAVIIFIQPLYATEPLSSSGANAGLLHDTMRKVLIGSDPINPGLLDFVRQDGQLTTNRPRTKGRA